MSLFYQNKEVILSYGLKPISLHYSKNILNPFHQPKTSIYNITVIKSGYFVGFFHRANFNLD